MIEPLAAAVVNSFLLRTPAGRASAFRPSVEHMGRSIRRPLLRDFFTPTVRQWKGKEKAVEQDVDYAQCAECAEWLLGVTHEPCCVMRHSVWCPRRNRMFKINDVVPRRSQTSNYSASPPNVRRYSSSLPSCSNSPRFNHLSTTLSSPAPEILDVMTSSLNYFLSLLQETHPFNLDDVWNAYQMLVDSDDHQYLKPLDVLNFAQKLSAAVEAGGEGNGGVSYFREWGTRLAALNERLESIFEKHSSEHVTKLKLVARASAFLGDLDRAIITAHELSDLLADGRREELMEIYGTLIRLMTLHQDGEHVLDFVLAEWTNIGVHLLPLSTRLQYLHIDVKTSSLQDTIYSTLANIPDAASLLARRRHLGLETRQRMGVLLLDVFCWEALAEDAYALLKEMRAQRISIQVDLQLQVVRSLVRADSFIRANELYRTISKSTNTRHKFFISTGMFLAAHQGDIDRAEEYYSQLNTARWITLQDKAILMHAYAVAGRVGKVVELFHEFFPNPKNGPKPSIVHYTIVVYAHAERADYDGLNFWLQAMSKAGLVPDIYVYSIILKSFSARGEVESVSAVLDQMRAAKIMPTRVLYTTVISLLAHRRDPVSAEAIYKRALREGITPDRKMITSLMNAHVEAGSWAGVVRVFDYLKSSRTPRLRLSIEVYNTLLKAYVLIGAPFHVVSTIFRKLEAMGVQPNGRTYTLIIQSACDAGYMNIANKIFTEMQAAAKDWQTTYRVDAFVLTIIMAGHLRLGDKRRAKVVYDDMCERGIQPTSATFHHILRAYGNERTEESFQIAEGFLKTIMAGESSASWIPPQTRAAALEHVYGPLMIAYTKTDKPEEVERLFQSMLDAGGEPSLGSLSVLLDAYRRSSDIEAIHGLWPQIWQLALRFSKTDSLFDGEDDNPSDPTKRQGNLLCVPLSIYIDALSAAGEHFVIAEMWGKARSHGFSFDSHNWNHLAVALVRAGEPERAFEIVERVLLPYQRQSEGVLRDRDLSPDSPLTFDVSPADVSKPVSQSPMHRSERRAYQSKVATKRSGDALEMDPTSDDFAHPLHILHQISPSWNVWRPHRAVLDLLSGVLRHLESGTPVQPVGDRSSAPQALEPNSGGGFTRGYLAREMLDRIYLNYPDTIQAIRLHERWTARKSSLTRQDDGW
ncbi:uncharacterized protein BJ212DRAFT_1272581 [Suillus subaureus]|uniref:Pentacotripeptide-repeat region of PRORP domain-containing protein n=1 Tax=Suillus subaureus TaxID=48587 RepID=A0A9P7EAI5_9AGAM|nr:uncharacterized protein BJ212DRAFT_1272581 [Suillus subaureus]KAG1815661.1 hypothetical protein BJ212DRAFT_1272581 [Suillus subaureus]